MIKQIDTINKWSEKVSQNNLVNKDKDSLNTKCKNVPYKWCYSIHNQRSGTIPLLALCSHVIPNNTACFSDLCLEFCFHKIKDLNVHIIKNFRHYIAVTISTQLLGTVQVLFIDAIFYCSMPLK